MTIPQVLDNKTARSHTAATALQMSVAAPVRARMAGLQPGRRGLHNQPLRAADCAPYLTLYAFGRIWRAAILAAGLLRPGQVVRLPTLQTVTARTHEAM